MVIVDLNPTRTQSVTGLKHSRRQDVKYKEKTNIKQNGIQKIKAFSWAEDTKPQ